MNTFCSYFNQGTCKSCDLITRDYPSQITFKESTLKTALAGLNHPPFLTTVVSRPENFRNKAKLVVTGTKQHPILGLWGEESLDQGRELLNCPLHVKKINEGLPFIRDFITLAQIQPYQIGEKKGELKGIILFHSEDSNESYLRFVLRSKESIDRIKKHHHYLLGRMPHLKCISVNIQPVPHALLEGEEEIFITDKKSIEHKLGGISLSLGPRAFVQTNQSVAEKLYATAAQWVKESNLKKFMELFCGQGAFSFFCAPHISTALGIEINPEAVDGANRTTERLKLPHLKFKAQDAGKIKKDIEDFEPEIILVNPPRRGLAESLSLLMGHRPKMIIYSSCNYETLSSDLKTLSNSYSIERVQLFDMFPHTKHFETLIQLRLKDD